MVNHRLPDPTIAHFASGDIDYLGATVKYALLESGYTPNYVTDEFFSAIDTTELTDTGYTAGGVTLASKTLGTIASSSVAAWQANTSYEVGDIVRPSPSDGHIYRCSVAGISGGTQPTFNQTFGATTVDSGVTWTQTGDSYLRFDAANPSWSSATFSPGPRFGIAYVVGTAGVADFILAIGDFEVDVPIDAGTFTVEFHSTGLLRNFRA